MSMSCLANTSKKLEITASLQAPSKSAVAGFEIQSEHRSGENSPGPSGWAQPGRLRRTKLGSCGVSGARMEKGWKNIGAFCFPSWICLWSWTPLCTCGVERLSVHIVHHSFVGLAKWLLFFVVLCMGAAQNPSNSHFPKVKIQQERARRFWRVRPYTSSCWWKPKQIWTPEVAGGNPWESRRRWISRNTMK